MEKMPEGSDKSFYIRSEGDPANRQDAEAHKSAMDSQLKQSISDE